MDDRTGARLRDGLLALVALGSLAGLLRRRGRLDALLAPTAAVAGVLCAVAVEGLMLRYPNPTRALWERRIVRFASLAVTVTLGGALSRRSGVRATAALCWGLLAYLVMLGSVLAGRSNPVPSLAGVETE